jgi:hypothetical protein
MNSRHFFRWKPTAILLVILIVLYGVFVPLNILLGKVAAQRGDEKVAHLLYQAAFWNAIIAILCFVGWRLMRRRSRVYLAAGGCAIAAALFTVMRIWINGLNQGTNPFQVVEVVLIWLPMLYAIIYAFRESKRDKTA